MKSYLRCHNYLFGLTKRIYDSLFHFNVSIMRSKESNGKYAVVVMFIQLQLEYRTFLRFQQETWNEYIYFSSPVIGIRIFLLPRKLLCLTKKFRGKNSYITPQRRRFESRLVRLHFSTAWRIYVAAFKYTVRQHNW